MPMFVLAGAFLLMFLISFFQDRRRFCNAVFLGGTLFCLIYGITEAAGTAFDQRYIFMDASFYWMLTFGILPLAILLFVDAWQMRRHEGMGKMTLLPAAAGAGILLLLPIITLVLKYRGDSPVVRMIALTLLFALYYNAFVLMVFLIYSFLYSRLPKRMDCDYIIIHGSGLMGSRITPLFRSRIDTALQLWERGGRQAVLIASGGRGPGEDISEAQAIHDYLTAHQVPEEKIVMEDRSTSTLENLQFSKAIMDKRSGGAAYRCLFATSNYHAFRTAMYARQIGLKGECVGAPTKMYYWVSAFLREYAAIISMHRWQILVWLALWWGIFMMDGRI